MSEVTADVAARWFRYWQRSSGSREERKALEQGEPADVIAAHNWVVGQIGTGGASAVRVLAQLAEAAPDETGGVMLGVGPIEDLVYSYGDQIVDLW